MTADNPADLAMQAQSQRSGPDGEISTFDSQSKADCARVVLVEDHLMFREQLARVVNAERNFLVCGEAESAGEGLRLIKELKPDLAVIDISLGDSDGISLIESIADEQISVSILVLSMHEEVHFAERAVKAGARGYVSKQEPSRQVILGMREVREGRIFLSPRVRARRPQIDGSGIPAPIGVLGEWVVYVPKSLEFDYESLRLFSAKQAAWTKKPLPILAVNDTALDLMINRGTERDWLSEDWPPVELKITVARLS